MFACFEAYRDTERKLDYRAGIIAAEIYNSNRTKKTQPVRSPFDYFEVKEQVAAVPTIRSAQYLIDQFDDALQKIHGHSR